MAITLTTKRELLLKEFWTFPSGRHIYFNYLFIDLFTYLFIYLIILFIFLLIYLFIYYLLQFSLFLVFVFRGLGLYKDSLQVAHAHMISYCKYLVILLLLIYPRICQII